MLSSILLTGSLATLAVARTVLTGCTTTDVSSPAGASVIWYVPGTGEICDFVDCGGGRAPPITTNPGCPLYSGTATYSPSYLPGYSKATPVPQSGSASASSTSAWAETSSVASSSEASVTSAASTGAWSSDSTSAIIDTIITSMTSASSAATSASPVSHSTAGGNGTVSTASPTMSHSLNAAPTAQAWMGGAGLLMGLGAVVAAL